MTGFDHTRDVSDIVGFLQAGEELGVALPDHLRGKLDKLAEDDAGKLKVALVGGFSEGKTSLAAAWLGMLPGDMKISQGESSNAVTIYHASDDVELIDTPGLFGFKEEVAADGTAERYKDLTRRYVSEADLVLYVLNPSNPLKDSHKDELNWLFRDLALLPRTVFVIGRFDMVADVDDEADYLHHLAIKREGVRARLTMLIGLAAEEAASLSIVAVAANPFDEGIASWLQRPEEYARLSHIDDLRAATARTLERVGGTQEAKRQTCLAILRDVADRLLPSARQAAEETELQAAIADGKAREEEPRLARFRREAAEAQIALSREMMDYFGDLIVETQSTDRDSFGEFFARKIGPDGVLVRTTVQNAFKRELGRTSEQLVAMSAQFAAECAENGAVKATLGKMTNGLLKNIVIDNKMILQARDWVLPTLKFRPYQAIKSARFANGAMVGIGVAIELFSLWQENRKAEQFAKDRQAIVDDLERQRTDILQQIDAPDFIATYFPQIGQMEAIFAALAAAFEAAMERNRRMRDWAAEAERLHLRFAGGSHGPAGACLQAVT